MCEKTAVNGQLFYLAFFCFGHIVTRIMHEVILMMVHPVVTGKNTRMSYSRIREVLDMPNLIEVQKKSYEHFLDEGLREVFRDVSPITDYTGNLILEFLDYTLDKDNPKYPEEECKERDTTTLLR